MRKASYSAIFAPQEKDGDMTLQQGTGNYMVFKCLTNQTELLHQPSTTLLSHLPSQPSIIPHSSSVKNTQHHSTPLLENNCELQLGCGRLYCKTFLFMWWQLFQCHCQQIRLNVITEHIEKSTFAKLTSFQSIDSFCNIKFHTGYIFTSEQQPENDWTIWTGRYFLLLPNQLEKGQDLFSLWTRNCLLLMDKHCLSVFVEVLLDCQDDHFGDWGLKWYNYIVENSIRLSLEDRQNMSERCSKSTFEVPLFPFPLRSGWTKWW
jgi:hypothetical protein